MFIRFKRVRLSEKLTYAPRFSVHLVLVESIRVKGKPRQRVLKYLGSIREKQLNDHSIRREFLKQMEDKIDTLNLHPRDGARLKVELIRKSIRYGRSF